MAKKITHIVAQLTVMLLNCVPGLHLLVVGEEPLVALLAVLALVRAGAPQRQPRGGVDEDAGQGRVARGGALDGHDGHGHGQQLDVDLGRALAAVGFGEDQSHLSKVYHIRTQVAPSAVATTSLTSKMLA